MQDTTGESMMNSEGIFFHVRPNMNLPLLADKQELIYNSFVRTQDVVWKSCQVYWMIRTDGERERGGICCQHDNMVLKKFNKII